MNSVLNSVNIADNPTIISEYNDGSGTFDAAALHKLLDSFVMMPSLTSLNMSGLVAQHCKNGAEVAKAVAAALPKCK